MDKKYHRGGGEVVIPNKDIQPSSLTHFISIIQNLPVYAYCDPALPVGWIEGEEVYMVKTNKPDIWKKVSGSYYYFKPKSYRRIWIEPKQGQPHKCQYCGAMTTQHDDQCWNNPKNFKQNQPDFQREAEELYPDVEKQGISAFVNTKIQRAAHIKARQMSAGEVEELRRENDRLKADNMTHEYNEAEAQRFAPEYERQIREDEANKWREQVRKLREVLGKLREGLIESGLIFAYLEDSTHGKEGEVITHQRGKIKQLLNETK